MTQAYNPGTSSFAAFFKVNLYQNIHSSPGIRESRKEDEKLGRSRGGFSTKIHIRCEGKGKPITFILSFGQRNESIFH